MSLTVRKFNAQVKDPSTGNMIPAGLLSSDALGAIEDAKDDAVATVVAQGVTTRESIPQDYTALSDEVDSLETQLIKYGAYDVLLTLDHQSRTQNGVTYTWSDDNTSVTVDTGGVPSTGQGWSNYYVNTNDIPDSIIPGETYHVNYDSTDLHIKFVLYYYNNGTSFSSDTITSSRNVTIPNNTTGIVIRLVVSTNITVNNATARITMVNTKSNKELSDIVNNLINSNFLPINNTSSIMGSDDLNNYLENEVYIVSTPNSVSNLPETSVGGILQIFKVLNFVFQIFTYNVATTPVIAVRRYGISAQTWTDWKSISGGDSYTYNTTQEYNQYTSTNTYNVTPTITTDSNNYLAPTGDNTDVSGSIQTMLENTGICRLGPGQYWVSGVDMPEDSAIIGSGAETKIYLLGNDNTEGYAIKMNSRCTVRDMSILGNTENYTSNASTYPSESTIVQRHGILWQGDYSTTQQHIPRRGLISGCYIANFTGGGITMYDTGPNVISGINVSDCIIWHCYAGINISYRSEYNRFTNIAVSNCHYGAVNNGGNNVFSNCGFSKNIVGFIIDNSTGTMTNNSHGSVTNCTFNHTDGNTGTGILLNGVSYGEIFTGCQLFYGEIELTNCNGIVFSGLNAGAAETININGGTKTLFIGSMFRTAPTININNNSLVTFSNCYCYDGTEVNP